ncbi:hypothetical protein ACJO2E_02560 [Marinobacter sp. M1N3S26]|uniref:hypothetical protein n=1 Tax=Marinobacter sp. M1N3S26 TaxID=3382299 RepID=UPI00387A969A
MDKPTGNSLPEWTEYVRSGPTYNDRVTRLAEAPSGIRLLLGPGEDDRQLAHGAAPPPSRMTVVLPWPDKVLSPNSRAHWRNKHRVGKRYRQNCRMFTHEAMQINQWDVQALRDQVAAGNPIHVFLDFHPPNRQRRDDDNVVAAFKAGRDGLADALGIDDENFRTHPVLRRDHPVRRGGVRVVISATGPQA